MIVLGVILSTACNEGTSRRVEEKISEGIKYLPPESAFDTIVDEKQVKLFHLKNKNGIEMAITNYGAAIVAWYTPDVNGVFDDIVFGYNDIKSYLTSDEYQGCIVGRYANRIARGQFSIDGTTYQLAINNEPNTLHGGDKGFNRVVWDAEQTGNKVTMTYVSPHMEEGYPGTMTVKVVYKLTGEDELLIDYEATTDQKTIVNLSNHSFFNLKGRGDQSVLQHELFINAEAFTPVDATLIPTGEVRPVKETPFDFHSKPEKIGARINDDNLQLKNGLGYDHNWVLKKKENEMSLAVSLFEPESRRSLEIYTTAPGLQFYSGNFFDGSLKGKKGENYNFRCGIALEPQHFPDSPNQPGFPSTFLNPGDTYKHSCIYKIINP